MKRQKSCGPRLGKLVHQLPGVVTFAYDLRFRRMIARWKDLSEKYNFWVRKIIYYPCCSLFSQKTSFRASKWPRKLKTAKNSKLPKLPETCFGPVGEGGWPPISTWIREALGEISYEKPNLESFGASLIREEDKLVQFGVINTAGPSNKALVVQQKDKPKYPKKKHPR
jgi:hypothetical protein